MPKKKEKYPYLFGCYVDEGFEREYKRKGIQGFVRVSHYKGAMMLMVKGEPHGDVWLRGEDLDAVIELLREAKKVWLRAYRKAERELIKRGHLKKPRKR